LLDFLLELLADRSSEPDFPGSEIFDTTFRHEFDGS
jgi:hypothetical protein